MFRMCGNCEFGTGGIGPGFCRKALATYVSEKTIRDPKVRLRCQNHLVGLYMSNNGRIDWMVRVIRDFAGRYYDEQGALVPVPGYSCLLRAGTGFWFRDQLDGGKWMTVADVPKLRSEAVGRWRLIATVIGITETVQPICDYC